MHLSTPALAVMGLVLRRTPELHQQYPILSILAKKSLSGFCPVYSAPSKQTFRHGASLYQAIRSANTSSGYYAPASTMTSREAGFPVLENHNVFEDSDHLPSLPVPNLNDTLEKLQESISPVAMNSAEFAQTLQLIEEFSKSAGQKLDLLLKNKALQTKNWMTHDWWVEHAYLKSRNPLVINSNPSMIYPVLPFEVDNQRSLVNVISQLVSGIIDFKLALLHGYNPEATSRDNEYRLDGNLCYSQYKYIFGSTRLPGEQIDSIQYQPLGGLGNEPFNLVISYRGKFFEVQLKDIENEKGRIDELASIVDKIIASIKVDGEYLNGAGVLTTTNRDNWAGSIKLLDEDSIEAIRKAQFVVCIDTIPQGQSGGYLNPLVEAPVGSDKHLAALGRQILHGDQVNVGNRWFDKAIQLIVVADDKAERLLGAGINYEHSFAEGIVVTRMIEYSYDKIVQNHRDSSKDNFFSKQKAHSEEPATFRQLKMFDDKHFETISAQLMQARRDFVSQVNQFDLSYFGYRQYGSNAIKSWHFSPDSWFQVALQLAYFNLHKRLGTCYESASTRRYAYGRTETIRSLTKEVAHFCSEPRFDTMQAAIQSHKANALAAGNGAAIDRVLMGYRMVFNELKTNSWAWNLPTVHDGEILKLSTKGRSNESDSDSLGVQNFTINDLFTEDELAVIGAFFNNELIRRTTRFALSTSQVSSVHPNIVMSYGPILTDGYGCCYNITGQQIVASISANSSNQSFSCEVDKLNGSLKDSLDTMRDIVDEHRCSKS